MSSETNQIQIAFSKSWKRGSKVTEMTGFATVDEACDALLSQNGVLWGLVQVGYPYNWDTVYKYSRTKGLVKFEPYSKEQNAND